MQKYDIPKKHMNLKRLSMHQCVGGERGFTSSVDPPVVADVRAYSPCQRKFFPALSRCCVRQSQF